MTFTSFLLSQCQKIDLRYPVGDTDHSGDTLSPVIKSFFNGIDTTDFTIRDVANIIYREEKKKHFIEDFVSYAGYPIWNKTVLLISEDKGVSGISTKGGNKAKNKVLIIPLVLKGDSAVNAVLQAYIIGKDTTFKTLYRWQYKRNGYYKKDGVNNAEQTAMLFMGLEKIVFGHEYFRIRDSLLFRKNDTSCNFVRIKSFNGIKNDSRLQLITISICYTEYFPGHWVVGVEPGGSLPLEAVEVCNDYNFWAEVIEGGGGDTGGGLGQPTGTPPSGGGGGDNGGWNSNPCGGLTGPGVAKTQKPQPCGDSPAWEPVGEPPLLEDRVRDANGYLYSRIAELQTILHDYPQALLPCDSLNIMPLERYGSMWQNVAQFKPSRYVMDRIDSIRKVAPNWIVDNFYLESLEKAYGAIVNCDFFPVRITKMPSGYTPESLLEHYRTNINSFINPDMEMSFGPYSHSRFRKEFIDTAKYYAPYEASVGSLWHLDLGNKPGVDGSVIESGYTRYNSAGYQTHHLFSVLGHPVVFLYNSE